MTGCGVVPVWCIDVDPHIVFEPRRGRGLFHIERDGFLPEVPLYTPAGILMHFDHDIFDWGAG